MGRALTVDVPLQWSGSLRMWRLCWYERQLQLQLRLLKLRLRLRRQ